MLKKSLLYAAFLTLVLVISSAGCSTPADASDAVLSYLQALSSRDENRLVLASCAAWEAQARTDLEAFSAVTVSLENASCTESGEDGDNTLVVCSGKIIANYGNEILEIDLADRAYLAVFEGGEWRMCGYR